MSLGLYFTFVAAAALLIAMPGPNVALIVANSLAYGSRVGLLTVLGTSTALSVQLLLTVLGMTTVLGILGSWFAWLRWIGVAYLVFLGIKAWRAPPVNLAMDAQSRRDLRLRTILGRGFLVSLTNPKTLLFFGAFFPQFVTPGAPDAFRQVILLAVTFLVIAVVFDCAWAVLAGRLRARLAGRQRLHNRVTGSILIGAGAGLALARKT